MKTLCDEDDTSHKDGFWKRLNTLGHYGIKDEAKMRLYLEVDRSELSQSMTIKTGRSMDSSTNFQAPPHAAYIL